MLHGHEHQPWYWYHPWNARQPLPNWGHQELPPYQQRGPRPSPKWGHQELPPYQQRGPRPSPNWGHQELPPYQQRGPRPLPNWGHQELPPYQQRGPRPSPNGGHHDQQREARPPSNGGHPTYQHRAARPAPNESKAAIFLFVARFCILILAMFAISMAGSAKCTVPTSGAVSVTLSYSQFRAFRLLLRFSITAGIMEVAALVLWYLRGDNNEETVEVDMEEEEKKKRARMRVVGIMLMVVDVIVLVLLCTATMGAFTAADDYSDQIGGCPPFSRQVTGAKLLSLAAFIVATLLLIVKQIPPPLNVGA